MTGSVWQGRYDSFFIGGEWVAPATSDTITVVSPFTQQPIATVPAGTKADLDSAVAAARRAFDGGPWPRMNLVERSEVMQALVAEMASNERTMAELVTAEMGSPIAHSVPIQAQRPRLILDQMITLARDYPFDEIREAPTGRARVLRRPRGVLGAIVPWNAPHLITLMKLAPALIAGCTAVVKSSPESPLDQYLFAEMVVRAGLPPGVLNIIAADRGPGEHLVTHPDVDMISFTGSTAAGRRIAALCGELIRPVTLELGGKSAAIVLDDVDAEATAESLLQMAFRNNGEVCTAKTRFILPRSRSNEIVEALVAKTCALKVGDPFDEDVYFGPLVSSAHRDRVEGMMKQAVTQGATVLTGGGRPKDLDTGWFVEPTIFADVDPSMTIAQEEVFGPVGLVLEYGDDSEAIAIANHSRYGLSGSVFGLDAHRAAEVATRIQTGMVEVNGNPAGLAAPFGGLKESGLGHELGAEGFDEFLSIQSIGLPRELAVRLGDPAPANTTNPTSTAGKARESARS